jgi:hypothetical protein
MQAAGWLPSCPRGTQSVIYKNFVEGHRSGKKPITVGNAVNAINAGNAGTMKAIGREELPLLRTSGAAKRTRTSRPPPLRFGASWLKGVSKS